MVEPTVDHQIPPKWIRYRPKITDSIGSEKRLREVPELAGDREFLERVRDGERLTELRPPYTTFGLFGHDRIRVVVKARNVLAH